MKFRFLRGEGDDSLESIEAALAEMFGHDRSEFDMAMSALLGDVPVGDVNAKLRSTDQRVNALQRLVRRELAVHASVYGGIDTPAVLVYMSIVKDVERLGDYAKNLMDLARDGANFSHIDDEAEWRSLGAEIAGCMSKTAEAFAARDEAAARRVVERTVELMGYFDRRVAALVRGEDQAPQPVARALAFRYLKRVVAHLGNVLSSIFMPVDKLDYHDEDPQDR